MSKKHLADWENELLGRSTRPVRRGSRARRRPAPVTRPRYREPQPPKNPRKAILWYKNIIKTYRTQVQQYSMDRYYGNGGATKVRQDAATKIRSARAAIRSIREGQA